MSRSDQPPPSGPRPEHDNRLAPNDDWWAMGQLLSDAVARTTRPIEDMHRTIANRWLRRLGAVGKQGARVYDTATASIYSSVRAAATVIGSVAPLAAPRPADSGAPRLRSGLTSISNALWGDDLEQRNSRLALPMTFRDEAGQPIELSRSSVAKAFPSATGDVVVLIHGLGETERCWHRGENSLPKVMDAEGQTPVLVRYNTGRHISVNGDELSNLVERLVAVWPTSLERISLIGNSMGGLVARSAVDAGLAADVDWPSKTRHLVTIGTPHLGSPLEKGANYLAWGLDQTATSRPLGNFLRERSAGIKDLRYGATRHQDWAGTNPDEVSGDTIEHGDAFAGIEQHLVAGVVTERANHPVGAAIGDTVVRVGSALGRGKRRRIYAKNVMVVGRQRHSDLATDPTVHAQISRWLAY